MKYNDFYTKYEVYIELYLIGYLNNGESILIVLRDKENIWFTAVVDAFKYYNVNKTLDIIKELNIQTLDLLCLTHTHKDHYLGFVDILDYFGYEKIENLCLPMGHSPQELFNLIDINKYPTLKKIFSYIKNNLANFGAKYIKANQNTILYDRNFSTPNINSGTIKIQTFCPLTHIIEQSDNKNIMSLIQSNQINDMDTNNYSVGINITFGSRTICLMSDILDKTFDELQYLECYDKNIDFLKIPHHGSKTSLHCLSFFKRNKIAGIEYAGVTSYKQKSALPELNIINNYYKGKVSNIHCTSNIINREAQTNRYGYLKYTIPFDKESPIKVKTFGNSIKIV